MNILKKYIDYLCGEFNNNKQIEEEQAKGEVIHPKAVHINDVCNHKFKNLPDNFNGYFVIEESYYTVGDKKNILQHLFLFTLNEKNNVVLTSYDLPKDVKPNEFTNNNEDIVIDYNELKKSSKFQPIEHKEENGFFKAESISDFGGGVTLTVKQRIGDGVLFVSEVFRKNGIITFGVEEPIIYNKV